MKRVFFLLTLIWCAGCKLNSNQLQGRWQAVGYYQEGHSLPIPLDSVSLVLSPQDKRYEFRSMGSYREAGPFRAEGHYLFLKDTTEQPAQERIIRVLYLSTDTLKILMMAEGKEQELFLKRQQ